MLEGLTDGVIEILIGFVNLLPESPFANLFEGLVNGFPDDFPYTLAFTLNFLNWLFPVAAIMELFSVWLFSIALYYVLQIVLRWGKVIS